jgi:flavin-dependent dehydrogenase
MIEQAERVGVNLLWQSPVNGLEPDGVLVGGKTIGAHWIVGADGIHSRVRRWCRLDAHPSRRRRYAFRRHYHLEPWSDCMEVYWGRRSQAYVTPVGRQDVCVVLVSSIPAVRSSYIAEEFPELAVRLASAERSKERGEVTLTHSLKRVYRGRVALVGDASGSVDAITGEGLSLSFRQAEALALSLQSGNLQAYQTAHRRLARRPAAMGRLLLMLDRHPRLRERALRTLAAHPEVFARTLAVHVGATSVSHLATTGALMGWHFVTA